MSETSILAVTPDRRPSPLAGMRNGFGWSPSIWRRLLVHRGDIGPDEYVFGQAGDAALDVLWREIETLPEWQQAPLVLTFDTGVIPWQEFEWAADQLDEFERRLPEVAGRANHVTAVASVLRSKPEAPFVGIWGTSVTENPFDPWDYDADEPGNGIPLSEMYLLARHRHHPHQGPS